MKRTHRGLESGSRATARSCRYGIGLLAATALLCLWMPLTVAQTRVIAYAVPAGTAGNQPFGGALGMDFDVDNPIVITRLGVFDDLGNGLNLPITARLYRRSDLAPLARIDFTPGDSGELIGGSRFKALQEPLRLEIGFQGTIVAEGYGATERLRNASIAPIGPVWTLNDGNGSLKFVGTSRWGAAPGEYPVHADTMVAEYAAGTFEFEVLPPLRPGTPALRVRLPAEDAAATLLWDPVTEPMPAAKYVVYRAGSADGPFSPIGEGGLTSYYDSGLANDVPVFYKVVAVGSGGEASLDSNIVTVTPNPRRPGVAYVNPPFQEGNQAFSGSLGMDFDVVRPIQITKLGVFDEYCDGLSRILHAAIWNRKATNELVSLEFTPEDPGELAGGSRFKELPHPLVLSAGFQGTIVAYGYGPNERVFNTENRPDDVAKLGTFDGGSLLFVGLSRWSAEPELFPERADRGPANRYAAGTFCFEPITPGPTLSIRSMASGRVEVSWTGRGTIQEANQVTGPWTVSGSQANPQEFPVASVSKFFRVIDDAGQRSVNVVGYCQSTVKPGFNLIGNPLNNTGVGGNAIGALFGTALPDGTCVYKFVHDGLCQSGGHYEAANGYTTLFGWDWPTMTLEPGEGMFLYLPPGPDIAILFVGEVEEGSLVIELCAGYNMVSSKVPQAGRLQSDLGYVPSDGDLFFRHIRGGPYDRPVNYTEGFGYVPAEPSTEVGEAFWIWKASAGAWTRDSRLW
ncbi:MAG TPA: hypothetical protein P5534_01460 [Candidatus Paceibacterota bacterium]|nr:hypothetical protein [Candidatus Paceibacterota bacterium]HRZ58267.1 hypothetical protein [Candidatus Paceibacterota bacterium]